MVEDGCHEQVLHELNLFLEKEEEYNYQPETYYFIKMVRDEIEMAGKHEEK